MISNKQFIKINSNNRVSGDRSDFIYKINLEPNKKFNRIVLLSCSFPRSFYLITTDYTFEWYENITLKSFTIPTGIYSRRSLQNYLQTNLTSNGDWTYTITYANQNATNEYDNGHYTFNVTGNSGANATFNISSQPLADAMGLEIDTDYIFNDSLESVRVCNFAIENNIYLTCDIVKNHTNDILAQIISASSIQYSFINYICPDIECFAREIKNTNETLHFAVVDENNNKINLNGVDWSMEICLFYDYGEDFFNLVKNMALMMVQLPQLTAQPNIQ